MYDDGIANAAEHAVYKGLALGMANGTTLLYATDLHNSKVDVFDATFAKPAQLQGKFIDPTLPSGYAPFGIAALNDQLYVTYAMQDAAKHDEQTGAGLGFVDIFDFSGNFVSRFASGGALDVPGTCDRAVRIRHVCRRPIGGEFRRRKDQCVRSQWHQPCHCDGIADGREYAGQDPNSHRNDHDQIAESF